jgi:hypothetical protein
MKYLDAFRDRLQGQEWTQEREDLARQETVMDWIRDHSEGGATLLEVRELGAVWFMSMRPLTDRERQRGLELAKEHGWAS